MIAQTRLSLLVTAACLLFNSTVSGHPIPALSVPKANVHDPPIERRSEGTPLWQAHSYQSDGFQPGHPTAGDHDLPTVTDHAPLQHQPTHLQVDASLSQADPHNHLSAGQPSFGYLPSLPQLEAQPQGTSGAMDPVSFPHPPSHQHKFLPQSDGNPILSTPLIQGNTIPSAHSSCNGFSGCDGLSGHPNAADHDSRPIITGPPLMPQNWVPEHSPSFLQTPNHHYAPPQQMHPGVFSSQVHPHANNNHWGAGRPFIESLPQIQHQGKYSVEPVSFPHPQRHQDDFLPQSHGNLMLSTPLTQGESVQNLGSHIPSPQESQGLATYEHDLSPNTQKKRKTVVLNRKRDYEKLLAGYELDLSDQATRSVVKEEQDKWWKEQEKTSPDRYQLYQAMLKKRRDAWEALVNRFSNTQLETLELGFTRDYLMHMSDPIEKRPANPARTKAIRSMRFHRYLKDKHIQGKVEAELREWRAKLEKNDPEKLKEAERKIEGIQSSREWDNPKTDLSREERKILELGEWRHIMQKIGSNPPTWIKKKKQFRSLYQQVAVNLNRKWSKEKRSELASVRKELKAAIPVVMLSQSSKTKIMEMGTLWLLDKKMETVRICGTKGEQGLAAFLGYIQGLQKNEKSEDVAEIQRLLEDTRFREDNVNWEEFVDIDSDDNEEDGAREGVGEKQREGPGGVPAQPM